MPMPKILALDHDFYQKFYGIGRFQEQHEEQEVSSASASPAGGVGCCNTHYDTVVSSKGRTRPVTKKARSLPRKDSRHSTRGRSSGRAKGVCGAPGGTRGTGSAPSMRQGLAAPCPGSSCCRSLARATRGSGTCWRAPPASSPPPSSPTRSSSGRGSWAKAKTQAAGGPWCRRATAPSTSRGRTSRGVTRRWDPALRPSCCCATLEEQSFRSGSFYPGRGTADTPPSWRPQDFQTNAFRGHVERMTSQWEELATDRLLWNSAPLFVLHYERLLMDPLGHLRKILRFLGMPVDEERLRCLATHLEGSFKRSGNEDFDPYTEEEKRRLSLAVERVQRLLRLMGYPDQPLYEWQDALP
nr:uncharacterized protein LOC113814475 [Penaeus vannamei]